MPVVPMSNGPSVREAPIQTPRVQPVMDRENFGGGESQQRMAQAAQGLIDTGFKIAAEEKQKADKVRITEAIDQTIRERNRIVWDPKSGAMTKKGKDALGASQLYSEEFDKVTAEIENGLSNEAQKSEYREVRRKQRLELDSDLEKHAFVETQKYQAEVSEAGVVTERDDGILNYTTPGKVASSIENQKAIILEQANREGKSPEWTKLKIQEAQSKTHLGVIDRMLNTPGKDELAQEYFNQVKNEIDGSDIGRVEKLLEEGTLRGSSQRKTDEIVSKSKNLSQALEEARKITDPKLRDETTNRVKSYFSEQKAAEAAAKEEAYIAATNIIEKSKNFDQVPPAMLLDMTPTERNSLRSYADSLREGKKPVTDWDEYYNFKSMASSPGTKNKFMQVNLMQYRTKLADSEFKELVSLQTQMRNGDDKADKILDGYRTDAQIVDGALLDAGFDPTPKAGTDDAKKVNQFRRMIDERIARHQEATGKKASNEEIQSIVDTMMVKGITEKGWFWDTKKRLFELDPGESLEIGVEDVPPGEKAKIESALMKRGLPITSENVVKLFKAKVQGTRGN